MSDKRKAVSVALLCNDGDHGTFIGRLEAVRIGDDLLNLIGMIYESRCLKLEYDFTGGGSGWGASPATGRIKVSRRWFPIVGYTYGFGNWCWDLVMMDPAVAVDLINYLKQTDHFHTEDGEDWFNARFNEKDFVFDREGEKELELLAEFGYAAP